MAIQFGKTRPIFVDRLQKENDPLTLNAWRVWAHGDRAVLRVIVGRGVPIPDGGMWLSFAQILDAAKSKNPSHARDIAQAMSKRFNIPAAVVECTRNVLQLNR